MPTTRRSTGLQGGRAAGQQVGLLDTLRGLVGDYPAGLGVVKEFLQNADDAGASCLKVTFDGRTHMGPDVSPEMRGLMGPALLFENDSLFDREDLEAIRRIGAGNKRHDVARTGQFGRGFNTAYAVTDYPAFVTGNLLRCFDPFDDMVSESSGDHGWEWTLQELECPTWLRAFGIGTGADALEGTVFRLPLRTAAQARPGRLVERPFRPDEVLPMLQEVAAFGSALLLFTRHVLNIEVWEIDPSGQARMLAAVRTENAEQVEENRAALRLDPATSATEFLSRWHAKPADAPRRVYPHHIRVEGQHPSTDRWLVAQGFDATAKVLGCAKDMVDIGQKAIPRVGAACRIDHDGSPRPVQGRLFCTLPLPGATPLSFHVNGFFDLDGSRRGLTEGTGKHEVRTRTEWNKALTGGAVPRCAGWMFDALTTRPTMDADRLYAMWPLAEDAPSMLSGLARGVLEDFADRPSVRVHCRGQVRWVRPTDALRPAAWSRELGAALMLDGLELVDPALPERVTRGLAVVGREPKVAGISHVKPLLAETTSEEHHTKAPLHCLREPAHIESLVSMFSRSPAELDGLPLSLRVDGTLLHFSEDSRGLDASPALRELVPHQPGFWLDPRVAERLADEEVPGRLQVADTQLPALLRWVIQSAGGQPPWGARSDDPLDLVWVEKVLNHLSQHPPKNPRKELAGLPLLVDDQLGLREFYAADAPCRPGPLTHEQCCALRSLGVPTVGGPGSLRAALDYLLIKLEDSPLTPFAEAIADGLLRVESPPESLGGLIDLLAQAHWDHPLSTATLRSLAGATIWPTGNGLRAVSDPAVYVPSGFKAPPFGEDVHLLDPGPARVRQPLYEAMGAQAFTLEQFVRRVFLTRFGVLGDATRMEALRWLSKPSRRGLLDKAEGLRGELSGAPIAPTTCGRWLQPTEVYHPDEESSHSMLGDRGPALDASEDPSSLLALFVQLGMRRTPAARHLLLRIEDLSCSPWDDNPDRFDALNACFEHLARKSEEALKQGVDGRPLCDHLRELKWLPALREGTDEFGVFLQPEERLYRADELYPPADGWLVASQAALCGFQKGKRLLKMLGAPVQVPMETAREHFLAVRDAWKRGEVSDPVAARTAHRFYVEVALRLADALPADRTRLLRGMSGEVLWDESSERFWRPEHSFSQPVPYFLTLRAHIPDAGSVGAGMDLLGRRSGASVEDLVAYLADLDHATSGRSLDGTEHDSALHVLMQLLLELRSNVEGLDGAWQGRRRVHLLDNTRRLRPAADVLREDAPWWAKRLDPERVALLSEQVGYELAGFAGVDGVSERIREELVEDPVASSEGSRATAVCDHFRSRLRSGLFELGLRRLIHHQHQELEPPLEDALALRFQACVAVTTELTGAPLAPDARFGRKRVEVYLGAECLFIAGEEVDDVLPDVAVAVNRRLGRLALDNLAPLEEILRVEPSVIEARLDRRRVPPLPTTVDPTQQLRWEHPVAPPGSGRPAPPAENFEAKRSGAASSSSGASSGRQSGGHNEPTRFGGPGEGAAKGNRGWAGNAHATPSVRPRDGSPRVGRRGRRRLVSSLRVPSGPQEPPDAALAARVAAAALELALAYESQSVPLERVRMCPADHPGYDLVRDGVDGEPERVIEVKGIAGAWTIRGVGLHPAQAKAGLEHADHYWVYVVEHALDRERSRVFALPNPMALATAFQLDHGWQEVAERAPSQSVAVPVAGQRPG